MITNKNEIEIIYKNAIEEEKEWFKNKASENDKRILNELFDNMNKIGYDVKYLADFTYRVFSDKKIIPLLKKYIDKFDDIGVSGELIYVIGNKGYYESTEFIINQIYLEKLEEQPIEKLKMYFEYIDNALYRIRDKRFINEYLKIISNKYYARYFGLVIEMIGIWQVDEAKTMFLEYLNNPDICFVSIRALANYRDESIIKFIEPFLNSDDRNLRKAADRTIKNIKRIST